MGDAAKPLKLLVLGAHPDDAEYHAGGLAASYVARGHSVKLISVTDGGSGHYRSSTSDLILIRRQEARRAGQVLGVQYETWDFPDGHLQPTLEVRAQIIAEIRRYQPDLVVTHRPCDYHPDHRAVGQAVQDASYMVTVPLVLPQFPYLRRDPVVAYMCDLFTKPYPFQPDIVLDITPHLPTITRMLACHHSQFFEFLPFNQRLEATMPPDESARQDWLTDWYQNLIAPRAERFREALVARYGEAGRQMRYIEAYEISEYAARLTDQERERFFPDTTPPPTDQADDTLQG
jgi:N-acetylglucosamine malate deacetylase 1